MKWFVCTWGALVDLKKEWIKWHCKKRTEFIAIFFCGSYSTHFRKKKIPIAHMHCFWIDIHKTHLIQPVEDEMLIRLRWLVLDVLRYRIQNRFDTNQNYHFHRIGWLAHSQHLQNQHTFAPPGQTQFHWDIKIESLAPESGIFKFIEYHIIFGWKRKSLLLFRAYRNICIFSPW